MLKWLDQGSAVVLGLVGLAHVGVAYRAFTEPSEAKVWFLAAGLFGLTAGLANLARARAARPDRLMAMTALIGGAGVVLMGALLIAADPAQAGSGPALVVLVAGLVASAFSLRDLLHRPADAV